MSIYNTLNDMQQEAVRHTEGPLLVLAGAGSGKTRVLTHRIAYLIEEKGVNPWNIMAITFTNKAAGEMRERVDRLVGFGAEHIWVSTFHSSCVRILRRYIDRIGYENDFTIYDADDQKTLMKEVCKQLNIDTKKTKERAFLSVISQAKDALIGPLAYAKDHMYEFEMKPYVEAYKLYQEKLKKNNALDFDDLIFKTVELFRACPDVLESYQERFRYIMVDEYQDTNHAQFVLINLLASKYRNICVVGDDDQSIYKFRGADIRNILEFEQAFEGAKVVKLEQNYRSTQNILDTANQVIRHNTGRKSKKLWTENATGKNISFISAYDGYREAEIIASQIEEDVRSRRYQYQDIACLYRTNAQSRTLEEKFLMHNIPYKIVGGVNFYQRKEIKDVLAYLKTVESGKDDVAAKRIINVPKRGIGQASIDRVQIYADARGLGFFEALEEVENIAGMSRAMNKINDFTKLISDVRKRMEYLSLTELARDILDEIGYLADLQAEGTDEANGRIENIEEFLNKLTDYENSAEEPTLTGFLEEVALVADIDSLTEENQYVVLMTIHSAKGLEFPKVYLTGMEEGLFPSYMTMMSDDPDEVEEERRLCYVAITRAREELVVSAAKMRTVHGETRYNPVSRFVKEMPQQLLEEFGAEDDRAQNSFVRSTLGASSFGSNTFSTAKPSVAATPGYDFAGNSPALRKKDTTMFDKPFSAVVTKGGAVKADRLEYAEGDRVKHIKFGEGTVLSIVDGGRDFEVTVEFDKAGQKKMMAGFAKLKKI
ncbi:MAG: DNA helicase PcrA [Lachnospiraceae bacterium]|nr:DNA helicase PcrA [Lachnospiraceae bacterium]